MQGIKYKYSIDALKVCYKIKQETYHQLTDDSGLCNEFIFKSPNPQDIYIEDFRLTRVKNTKREFNIMIPDEPESGNLLLYGMLDIKANTDEKFAGLCFVELDNRRLYEPYFQYNKVKFNTIYFLDEIASRLGLELVSISNLEVAFDSNINFARLIKNAIANPNYTPVINGHSYPNIDSREVLINACLQYSTSRKRSRNLSYLIRQSKGKLQLKSYDKSAEIETKSKYKTYIYRWLGMARNVHRMEITAKREPINAYCKQKNISISEFLSNLHTGTYIQEAYSKWLKQLLHFEFGNGKKSQRKFSVLDLPHLRRNADVAC